MPAQASAIPATAASIESNDASSADWEPRISQLLSSLSSVQGDLLRLLEEKRTALAKGSYDSLAEFTEREARLVQRLERCHTDRQTLLDEAKHEGLPAASVQSLAQALPASHDGTLEASVEQARRQSRLLQHHSLTNWVVVQRTLLHLSQMIEIIATGGRMQPTYGATHQAGSSGALVDREV